MAFSIFRHGAPFHADLPRGAGANVTIRTDDDLLVHLARDRELDTQLVARADAIWHRTVRPRRECERRALDQVDLLRRAQDIVGARPILAGAQERDRSHRNYRAQPQNHRYSHRGR